MKKPLKIILIVMAVIFGLFKLTEWYLQVEFKALINKNPDRAYDITYEDFDLHTFFKGITLNGVSITPINKTSGTIINGTLAYAELSGFKWRKFILSKTVQIDALIFVEPNFVVDIEKDSTKQKEKDESSKLQGLFGDILSRADLNEFEIRGASVELKENDTITRGMVSHLNIFASDIETDSVRLTQIIPFKLGKLDVTVDSAFYQIDDFTKTKLSTLDYSIEDELIELKGLAFELDKDWVSISRERGFQDDVLEFYLKSLSISGVKFSSGFWTNLDVVAQKMVVDSLNLSLKRNKNLPRPPDVEKPLFKGIVDKLPNNIDLDSIIVKNTSIHYGELSVHKQHTGVIDIEDVNGALTQFSTFPERKEAFGYFESNFTARLNGEADMHIHLRVPYDQDHFSLHTTVGPMQMSALNKSLVPLLGIEFNDGYMHGLDYEMGASYYQSSNRLTMDYEDLHLTVYQEADDGTEHKKGFLTSMANIAIRHHNLPEDHGYIKASYVTPRNIYRSPFQHIVAGVLDGAKHIVPGKGIQSIINKDNKKKKTKRKKKE